MGDQNVKRKLVIDVYNEFYKRKSFSEHVWIPTEWLSKWLGSQSTTVSPIDVSSLQCCHGNIDPSKVNKAKCAPTNAAEILYKHYGGDMKLDEFSLCKPCVERKCTALRFKVGLEKDVKEVTDLMRASKTT